MRTISLIALLTGLSACSTGLPRGFDHLEVRGRRVVTTHGLPLAVTLPADLDPLGETRFRESYGGPSFDVSVAAFANDSVLVAVHAETHTDGSGGLDYSELAPDSLAGIPVRSRVDCFDLREETEEDIRGNGFLRFLRERGFDFDRAYVLERAYLTNADGTAEVVLSYGEVVPACGEGGVSAAMAGEVDRGARRAFSSLTRR